MVGAAGGDETPLTEKLATLAGASARSGPPPAPYVGQLRSRHSWDGCICSRVGAQGVPSRAHGAGPATRVVCLPVFTGGIGKIGAGAAVLLFVILMVIWCGPKQQGVLPIFGLTCSRPKIGANPMDA
jgi:hypothetical protein